MGRLIDADKLLENQYRIDDSATLSTRDVIDVEDIEDAPIVEAIPKADYENRLATDMVTIKQLSNSVKTLQKANLEIAGAYDKLKADYEARLKADMVAMLEKIQLEIEELDPFGDEWSDSLDACNDIIQQKINSFKSESEEYINFADDLIPIMNEAESEE